MLLRDNDEGESVMPRKLLTLAITQKKNQDYLVICYDYLRYRLISLDLEREDIEKNGEVFFDIGAETEVEELREERLIYPVGYRKIIRQLTRSELQSFLEKQSINIESFCNNSKIEKYSIITVKAVTNLRLDPSNKLRMKFWSSGVSNDFLVKDFRWLTYIHYLKDPESIKYKIKEYERLFKSDNKTLYVILFRYEGEKYNAIWIAGLHYL